MAAVCAISASLVLPAQRAAAQDSCLQDNGGQYICRWTQLETTWPAISDPDCHDQCAYYLHGNCQYYWYSNGVTNSSDGVDYRGDMARAIEAWNGRPYCSPTFYDCKCNSAFLTIGAADLSGDPATAHACGVGSVTTAWQAGGQQYDNHIVSATAKYNTKAPVPWSQGEVSYAHCDAIGTSLHEVGHAMSEGHSSYRADIMCSIPGTSDPNQACEDNTAIDSDADAMLNTVYGPYHNNSSHNCGGCQMACPQTSGITQASTGVDPAATVNQVVWNVCGTAFALPDVSGYWAKTWDLLQGVSTPNLPQDISGSACFPYFAQKQLVPWIVCVTGNPIA